MMDELVNEVSTKTGLTPDQARSAIDSVLGFLKERLPAPLASGLGAMLGESESGSESDSGPEGGGLAAKASAVLGGLFKKDS